MNAKERRETLRRCFAAIYKQGVSIDNCRLRGMNITGAQVKYLEIIAAHPGISQDAIAKLECVDKGAIARAIKKLQAEHCVRREKNESDCRAWCLYLTEKGADICAQGEPGRREFEKSLFEGFNPNEIDTLVKLMGRMTQNIEKMKESQKARTEEK